ERYVNVSTFVRALESISLSPTSLPTSTPTRSLVAPPSNTVIARTTEPLEVLASEGSFATRLSRSSLATRLLDRPENLYHERDISKALDPSTDPLDAIPSDASLATRLGKNSLATHLLDRSEHDNHDHDTSKALDIPPSMVLETSPRDVHVEPLPRGRLPQ